MKIADTSFESVTDYDLLCHIGTWQGVIDKDYINKNENLVFMAYVDKWEGVFVLEILLM